jgi:hypothetical protein
MFAAFLFAPFLALYQFNPFYENEISVYRILILFIGMLSIIVFRYCLNLFFAGPENIRIDTKKKVNYDAIAKIMFYISLFLLISVFQFRTLSFDLLSVYTRRQSFTEISSSLGVARYLWPFASIVAVSFIWLVGLSTRSLILLAQATILTLVCHSIDGSKVIVLIPILLTLLYWYFNILKHRKNIWAIGFWSVVFLAIPNFVNLTFGSNQLLVLLTRRLGLVPARLSVDYFNYYDSFGPTHFSHSFMRRFIAVEDRINIPSYMGQVAWRGDSTSWYNANAFADGYVSFGLIAVILVGFLMAITLVILEALIKSQNHIFATCLSLVCVTAWLNTSFFTSILTNGILIVILLLTLFNSSDFALRPPKVTTRFIH